MSSTLGPLPSRIIRQWEEASNQLTGAVSNYLSSCVALESLSDFPNSTSPKDLTLSIDHILEFVHTIAFKQLAQSCSSLGRTRNRLTTSICSLPEEILSDVFRLVIYAPEKVQLLKPAIKAMYRRLHTLVSVCSDWRRIGLAQGNFWSTVPMIHDDLEDLDYATQLSLQRAGNSELHIAADLGHSMRPKTISVLREHAPRFRTLNIRSKHCLTIQMFLSLWLNHGVPGSVTELSICYSPDPLDPYADQAYNIGYFRGHGPYMPKLMSEFMAPLSTLRVSRAFLRLDNLQCDSLSELRVDNVQFHTQSDYKAFLEALSDMPSLHALYVISVEVSSLPELDALEHDLSISLPRLQTLYLEDLDPDLLQFTFESIAPGPYRIVLYARRRCYHSDDWEDDGFPGVDVEPLLSVLEGVNVSTLLLDITSGPVISPLLQALPTLDSLYLSFLTFDRATMMALTRPPGINRPFPMLRELHAGYTATVSPELTELFKDVVSSHAIEKLTLGGAPQVEHDTGCSIDTLTTDDEIVTWLRSRVRNFRLIHYEDGLPEFERQHMW